MSTKDEWNRVISLCCYWLSGGDPNGISRDLERTPKIAEAVNAIGWLNLCFAPLGRLAEYRADFVRRVEA